MTDTGQIPGEGLPENAGMVEQPGVPAPGAYTYLSETTAEDEDLLLLPGAQSAWGNEVAPPAPEPVVETVHEPGPHEMSGRDSGSVDLSGVRLPGPGAEPPSAQAPPRRPLHLGPPVPDTSASPVRSLADRGPADAPARHAGPPTTGPEYLDVPHVAEMPPQGAAPWGAQAVAQAPVSAGAAPAETVVPTPERIPEPAGAAQALVTRVAAEAVAATGGTPAEAAGSGGTDGAGIPAVDEGEPGTDPGARSAGFAAPGADAVPQGGEAVAAGGPVPGAAPEAVQAPQDEAGRVSAATPAPDAEAAPAEGVPAETDVPTPEPVAPEPEQVTEAAPEPVQESQEVAEPSVPEDTRTDESAQASVPEPAQPVEVPAPQQEHRLPEAPAPQDVAVPGTPGPEAGAPVPSPAVPATPPHGVAGQAVEPPAQEETAPPVPDAHVVTEPQSVTEAQQPAQGPQSLADAPAPAAADPAAVAGPGAPQEADVPPVAPGSPDAGADPAGTEAPAQAPQPSAAVQQPAAEPAAPEPSEATEPVVPAEAGVPVGPTAPAEHVLAQQPGASGDAAVAAEPGVPADAVVRTEPTVPADAVAADDAVVPIQPGAPVDAPGGQEAHPDQPMGQFVPVEGQVPTTPHLAPTPPQPIVLPAEGPGVPEAAASVPAPREAGYGEPGTEPAPELVQSADDLDTQGADQHDHEDQEDPHDVSTAAVAEPRQSTGPAAPAYDDAEREAVLKVMRERRDIRNGFRSDPIPHEVLLRVLEAAHTAPSVGHSQPWDFVVIRSADTRRAMHELAMRQRDAYAKSLPKGRAKQFKELKIEAILDTPVNIVVTADPTRGGRHTLGRHTQPQMAPYSSALAVENLWLAARAEGLGVGWVSFFDEREMVRALGLPEHLEVVAYLCVGYVDEFPDEPELMQAGWSKRRPLSWVVHEETYGRRALPGEDPHDLLAETVAQIRPLDAKALGEAWERQKRMTKPAGALGMLEIISAQLSGLSRQCPPPIPEPAAVAIFAGDHGVHAQGVTPWPQEVTAQMVANFLGGGAVCNAFATQVGAEVCVVDVGVAADLPATPGLLPRKVRAGTSDMTTGPAMSREEAKQAIEVGIETARDLVAAGNKALLTGEMGIANTTASAALISVFTGADPAEVTGRGTGINDETLARKTEVVRRALELHQPDPADPIGVLAAIGGFEHAAMVGLLLGGASLRTPVILDGVSAGAAALVARAIAPEVLAACVAGHRSAEPGHVAALNKLGLRPLVDLDLRLGEGTGALLALPMVQSTARAMHEVATFDSAGVTEK
ncbi:nicotinate-nucleotide--dimethylbenzimidazole phosphoribosyltransferase [Streptomyces viridiviolaceus]|uniref:Nicotinate-nucleotide--dimethylbenzimidazole phosphoribosyltransferase n=1 Tax=Streptomyces viridiviolaceus TaxID=68282 RepID=A0ABW2E2C8_9ACTN|nr:nicotinate-nucleotide--dimethylbenzimidazole phosphoribosyltransferase [Streptomyces viridiviolaceus]